MTFPPNTEEIERWNAESSEGDWWTTIATSTVSISPSSGSLNGLIIQAHSSQTKPLIDLKETTSTSFADNYTFQIKDYLGNVQIALYSQKYPLATNREGILGLFGYSDQNVLTGAAVFYGGGNLDLAYDSSVQYPIIQRTFAGDYTFFTTKEGNIVSGAHAVTASSDLTAGDFSLWLDQTIGAAKLMIKAKNSAGTVVSGSINLA